jgi:PIN domain nuclease of toxin-antitoxin system
VRALLDTHSFLWWVSARGSNLSPKAADVIGDAENEILFSAASAWEIAIKASAGRLRLPSRPERYVPARVRRHGFRVLPVDLEHALRVARLPRIHGDPFDRLLVAQAMSEGIPLVSSDPAIGRYDVEVIW